MNHKGQSTENTEYTEIGFCRLGVGGPFRLIRKISERLGTGS